VLELLLSCLANEVVLMEEVPVSIRNVLRTDILSFLPQWKLLALSKHQTLSLHTHTHTHTHRDCIWLISFWNNFKVNFYIFEIKNVRKHAHSWFLSFIFGVSNQTLS